MDQQNEHLVCYVCGTNFSSVSNKNRHLKKIHDQQPLEGRITKHIKCPLCSDEDKMSFSSHDNLLRHLKQIHSLTILKSTYNFASKVDFEAWRSLSNRNVGYVLERTSKTDSADEYMYYYCNRSNTKGFVSQCNQRNPKKGGSIKISGLCPSRITVKINRSGVAVEYIETHVGHNDELRSKHVSNIQQEMLASKLVAGVAKERLPEDESYLKDGKLDGTDIITIDPIIRREVKEIGIKDATLKLRALDGEELFKAMEIINKIYNNSQARKKQIDKQLDYSNKK